MTLQLRAFLALRECSMCATLLGEAIGTNREGARKKCLYMIARGIVGRHVVTPRIVIFYAIQGKQPPKDLRGKRPGSRRNHRGAVAWASWLRMMQARYGPTWRYRPKNDIALAQVWVRPTNDERSRP